MREMHNGGCAIDTRPAKPGVNRVDLAMSEFFRSSPDSRRSSGVGKSEKCQYRRLGTIAFLSGHAQGRFIYSVSSTGE